MKHHSLILNRRVVVLPISRVRDLSFVFCAVKLLPPLSLPLPCNGFAVILRSLAVTIHLNIKGSGVGTDLASKSLLDGNCGLH